MDLTSLYYFSELAKDLHMTRTANRLFISQQTLSNHIQRLEEHFGTKLLYRKPTLSLTYAGEHVLAFAQLVDKEYTNLQDILADVEHQERGAISFGSGSMRMNTCLPYILPEFSARYPHVEFRLTEGFSSQLEPMVLEGKLDFALILPDEPNTNLIDRHLLNDQVYLCVPDPLIQKYFGDQAEELKTRALGGADVADFASIPFSLQENRLGRKLMTCFEAAGVSPNIYLSSADTRIASTMCFQGISACFATHMRLINRQGDIPNNINIFPVYDQGQPLFQKISLIRRKDRYLPHYSRYFLELLFRYFDELDHIHFEHKV